MAKENDIKKLQADLKGNPELAQRINGSVLDILIELIKVLGYNITKADLEDAIKLEGDLDPVNAFIVWEGYVVVH